MKGSSAVRCVAERTPFEAEPLRACTTVFETGLADPRAAGSRGCASGVDVVVGLLVGPDTGGVGLGDGDG